MSWRPFQAQWPALGAPRLVLHGVQASNAFTTTPYIYPTRTLPYHLRGAMTLLGQGAGGTRTNTQPRQDLRAAAATRLLEDALGAAAGNQLFLLAGVRRVARAAVCGNQVCEAGERAPAANSTLGESHSRSLTLCLTTSVQCDPHLLLRAHTAGRSK